MQALRPSLRIPSAVSERVIYITAACAPSESLAEAAPESKQKVGRGCGRPANHATRQGPAWPQRTADRNGRASACRKKVERPLFSVDNQILSSIMAIVAGGPPSGASCVRAPGPGDPCHNVSGFITAVEPAARRHMPSRSCPRHFSGFQKQIWHQVPGCRAGCPAHLVRRRTDHVKYD